MKVPYTIVIYEDGYGVIELLELSVETDTPEDYTDNMVKALALYKQHPFYQKYQVEIQGQKPHQQKFKEKIFPSPIEGNIEQALPEFKKEVHMDTDINVPSPDVLIRQYLAIAKKKGYDMNTPEVIAALI